MTAMQSLVAALRYPEGVVALDGLGWSALLSVARAEVLLGTLACRLADVAVPEGVRATLDAARTAADQAQVHALWEAEMCRLALVPLGIAPILLKGTAYAAAGFANAAGRQIGDLDILVPCDRLGEVETALLGAGWEWVKDDPYDQAYYRQHMHELPPLIHRERDRMVDVHHTVLPLTAKPTPDAVDMIAEAVPIDGKTGVLSLSPADMLCHAAAHLFADGDLAGGLRNLWDIDRLLRHFSQESGAYWAQLEARARHHQLWPAVHRAARLAQSMYDAPIPDDWQTDNRIDRLFAEHLIARDDWGRESRPVLRFAFYIRSHLLRMPLRMLARHLWVKWRIGKP